MKDLIEDLFKGQYDSYEEALGVTIAWFMLGAAFLIALIASAK